MILLCKRMHNEHVMSFSNSLSIGPVAKTLFDHRLQDLQDPSLIIPRWFFMGRISETFQVNSSAFPSSRKLELFWRCHYIVLDGHGRFNFEISSRMAQVEKNCRNLPYLGNIGITMVPCNSCLKSIHFLFRSNSRSAQHARCQVTVDSRDDGPHRFYQAVCPDQTQLFDEVCGQLGWSSSSFSESNWIHGDSCAEMMTVWWSQMGILFIQTGCYIVVETTLVEGMTEHGFYPLFQSSRVA